MTNYSQAELIRKIEDNTNIRNIYKVIPFEPWFNPNCAFVIHDYPYIISLVIYEPSKREMKSNVKVFQREHWGSYNYSTSAERKVEEIKRKLNSDNPILAVYSHYEYKSIVNYILKDPEIIKEDLPYKIDSRFEWDGLATTEEITGITYTTEPEKYLNPLDIVKVNMRDIANLSYYHVGIYLGNNSVCHYSKEQNGTKIDSWERFLEGGEEWTRDDVYGLLASSPHGLYRHHPVIPFKHRSKIANQIAWSVDTNFRRNEYDLLKRNCEHFSNMINYGIEHSEQAESDRSIILENEIDRTNSKLGETFDSRSRDIELQARIEVPNKVCRIM